MRRRCSASARATASSGGASFGIATGSGTLCQIESAKELGPQRLRLCAGTPQLLLQSPQGALVPLEQLHLQLAEAVHDTDAAEDGDIVLDDLGARGAQPLAAGTQPCDGDELPAMQMGDEQGGHLVRWSRGWSHLLELDAMRAVRQLQLPPPCTVLEPMAEGDSMSREA